VESWDVATIITARRKRRDLDKKRIIGGTREV